MKQNLRLTCKFALRLFLGLIFIAAGFFKILANQEFSDALAAYGILPINLINIVAIGLPFFEIFCGITILTQCFTRPGVLGSVFMLGIFCLVDLTVRLRGPSVDCGCFGNVSWLEWTPTFSLIRDGLLLIMSVWLYAEHQDKKKTFILKAKE